MTDAPTHPIAITGMHRSGTSMITRGLHQSGLHLIGGDADALLEAADDNPEGFWENKAVVTCNDDLLEAAGGSWDNPPALLPMAVDDPRLAAVVEPATAALAGLAENDRWGFKDPRTCLTAAFWLDLQPDLRFVICVRNPLEVALSLKRRNQNSYSLGLSLWERYYAAVLDLVPEDRRIVTHYDTYFLDPVGELARVCAFAGLDPAPLEVREDLRHHDVGVGLDEANLGDNLRGLYARLCEEAGVPAPAPSVADEGQVRRLVLDGAVAARHAEQRQKAIERLEERLAESQAREKEAREQLAQVRRESESRRIELAGVTRELDHVRADTARRLDALEQQNQRILDTTSTLTASTHRLEERQKAAQRPGPFRRLAGKVWRRLSGAVPAATPAPSATQTAKHTAKAAARRLPQPVRHTVFRVRRAVADGQAGNRVKERAVRVVDALPGPGPRVVRRSAGAVRRSGAVPKAKRVARGVRRRVPAPVKRVVRRAAGPSASARRAPNRPRKASPAPRPAARDDGAAVVPKGPAAFKWQKGYERLVGEFVGSDAPWAVATPGCKPGVVSVGSRRGRAFPCAQGTPSGDSQSLIAVLEAMRLEGVGILVVPEGARAWYQGHPELRDHLLRDHALLADRPAAGLVFDLAAPAPARTGVLAAVKDLSVGRHELPAVLDWTGGDIRGDLPGFTTFVPAGDAAPAVLPYFDDSIEIVVTTAAQDLAEARRVASTAVVVVERVGGDLLVDTVDRVRESASVADTVVVVAHTAEPAVDEAVRARVGEYGAAVRFDADPASIDAEVVVVVEPGVVPLPGAIDAMVTAARRHPEVVSVAKVIGADGRVESAGGMVFEDGSVAGVAAGSLEVRAPWHEFNRPTAWGGGLVAATAQRWSSLPRFEHDDLVGWCGEVWSAGCRVVYRSAAVAVRVGTSATGAVTAAGAWAPHLASRPRRPAELGDGAWRYLLANDDIGALAPGGAA